MDKRLSKEWGEIQTAAYIKRDGSLFDNHPEICKFWDYKKNLISPKKVHSGHRKKKWWICPIHGSYEQSPRDKTRDSAGCKKCKSRTFSRPELRLLAEFKKIFNKVSWNNKIFGKEIDIYLPDYDFGIEVDGFYHIGEDKRKKDLNKNLHFKKKGIKIIRIRASKINDKIDNYDFFYNSRDLELKHIKTGLKILLKFRKIKKEEKIRINEYLERKNFINNKEYRNLIINLPFPPKGLSLQDKYPEIAKQWHDQLNKPLKSFMFLPGSNFRIWWFDQFNKNDYPPYYKLYDKVSKLLYKHEPHKMPIIDKVNGHGCDFCGRLQIFKKRQLAQIRKSGSLSKHQNIILEIKDKKIRTLIKKYSNEIPSTTTLELDWYCKIHKRSWKASITRRIHNKKGTGSGCIRCSQKNKKVKYFKNKSGKKYGLIDVISFHSHSTNLTRPTYKCKCHACGKIKFLKISEKTIRSCGCLKDKGMTLKTFLYLDKYKLKFTKRRRDRDKHWLKWTQSFSDNVDEHINDFRVRNGL